MIDVAIQYRPHSCEYAIWFLSRDAEGGNVYRIANGALYPAERFDKGGAMPDPTLIIDDYLLKIFLEAGLKIEKPSPATVRHLDDAIAVRDRLLVLVENAMKSKSGVRWPWKERCIARTWLRG